MIFQTIRLGYDPRHSVGQIVGEPLPGSRSDERGERRARGGAPRDRRPSTRRRHAVSARVLGRPARPDGLARALHAQPRLHRLRRASLPRSTYRSRRRSSISSSCCSVHRASLISSSPMTWPWYATSPTGCGDVYQPMRRDLAVGRALRQPDAPLHDLAPVGDTDSRPRGRATARDDPARRLLPRPREPARALHFHARCPFVQETRCWDKVPRAASCCLRSSGCHVPTGPGDQGVDPPSGARDGSRRAAAARGLRASSQTDLALLDNPFGEAL